MASLASDFDSYFQATLAVVRVWDSRELRDLFLSSTDRGPPPAADPEVGYAHHASSPEASQPLATGPWAASDVASHTSWVANDVANHTSWAASDLASHTSWAASDVPGHTAVKRNQGAEARRLSDSSTSSRDSDTCGPRKESHTKVRLGTVLPAVSIAASLLGLLLLVIGWKSYAERLAASEVKVNEPPPEGGWRLHTPGFLLQGGDGTCLSLKERHLYYPKAVLVPTGTLLLALREYESMHRRCVMEVKDWPGHFARLEAGLEDCKYLVWKENNGGVGDRFLSLVSAFEYALLTDRALLVSKEQRMQDLLCNPFERSSIWLPDAFPMEDLNRAPRQSAFAAQGNSGNGTEAVGGTQVAAAFLMHWIESEEFAFFCSRFQQAVASVPWMSWEGNQYVGPDLFLVPEFASRLQVLFPDRVVTSHMVRYLLHPVNRVWDRIATVYRTYFSFAGKRVGLQVDPFQEDHVPEVTQRVLDCATNNKILPSVISADQPNDDSVRIALPDVSPSIVVFLVSPNAAYYADLKRVYTEQPTSDNSIVAVHSESQAGQDSHSLTPDEKAVIEIWLLSLTDDLLISYQSTTGYIANALHGQKRAYYLNIRKDEWRDNNQAVCERAWSSNPCYHMPPLDLRCPQTDADQVRSGKAHLPYLRTCQDSHRGVVVVPAL